MTKTCGKVNTRFMHRNISFLLSWIWIGLAWSQETAKERSSTSIFPLQEKHVHSSSLVSLPNGDLLAAWFEGSGERKANDVCLMGARKRTGESTWSQPFLMADTKGLPDCNPVLFLNHRQELYLVWVVVIANRWEKSILKSLISTDYNGDGAPIWNWQDNILLQPDKVFAQEVRDRFKKLPPNKHGWAAYAPEYDGMIVTAATDPEKRSLGWMTRIKPLSIDGDTLLLPLYSDGLNLSLVAISSDGGKNWQPSLPIVGRGNVQPSLVSKKDGTLLAYMRDNGDAPGRVQWSQSLDGGKSWQEAQETELASGASLDVLRLEDGRWLMVRNDLDEGRYRLGLFLSVDEGRQWHKVVNIEEDTQQEASFSYPCLIQSADGDIHMTYSYKHRNKQETIKYVRIPLTSIH